MSWSSKQKYVPLREISNHCSVGLTLRPRTRPQGRNSDGGAGSPSPGTERLRESEARPRARPPTPAWAKVDMRPSCHGCANIGIIDCSATSAVQICRSTVQKMVGRPKWRTALKMTFWVCHVTGMLSFSCMLVCNLLSNY